MSRVLNGSGRKQRGFVLLAVFCTLLTLPLMTHPATAQSSNRNSDTTETVNESSLGPTLSQILQKHARNALERHLRPEEFQVFVTATPSKGGHESVPYLPETLSSIPSPEAPVESLASWLQKVDVEVLISDRHKKDAKGKLESILRKSLSLDSKRGDKITFSSIGLKVDPPLSDIQRDLARSEAEARDLKARLDAMGRERDDAKRDVSQTKAELDRIAREKANAGKNDKAGPGNADNKDDSSKSESGHNFWLDNLGVLTAALMSVLAIVVGSLAIRAAAKTLGAAVQTIGAGIPMLGDKISESLVQQTPALLPPAELGGRGLGAMERLASDTGSAGANMPIEAVARRVLELHDELMTSVSSANEGIVLEHLSWLLDDDSSVGHAVATMELLGKDQANSLYKKLAPDQQQMVMNFLRGGTHSRPKGEIMLEVGEALKTRLFGADLPRRAKLDAAVRNKLVQLGPDDLVQVARALEGDHLARFFAYIGPAKLAPVMTEMYKADSNKFAKAADLIAKIPSVETNVNLDHELVATIEAQISRVSADLHSPYLSYYRSLLQSVDDDVAAFLSERISAADTRVERYLRETVVTFATFFRLHGDIQEEIILGMNNRDLAALLASLKDELKARIYELLESRRRELIDEEIQRLIGKGLRQVNTAHRSAKEQVVARILQMKGSGSLSDLMNHEDNAKAPATQNRNAGSQAA